MAVIEEILRLLAATPNLQVCAGAPLARYTRFGVGGPADVYAETASEEALIEALRLVRASGAALVVIGGGTNLIVSDAGFRGVVLRFTAAGIRGQPTRVEADAGAELDSVVKFAGKAGLAGIETLAGIPGSFGAAVYGNAGAYGHSRGTAASSLTVRARSSGTRSGLSSRPGWNSRLATRLRFRPRRRKSGRSATPSSRSRCGAPGVCSRTCW